jgi:hypothetical protein
MIVIPKRNDREIYKKLCSKIGSQTKFVLCPKKVLLKKKWIENFANVVYDKTEAFKQCMSAGTIEH